jgi:lipid-A-disaccharide synthase
LLHFAPYNSLQKIYTGSIVNPPNPRIFLSAGEASGDHYGAQLIAEVRSRHPHAGCFGLGGKEMEAAGLNRIVRAEDVAHMGITEVIRHMPRVYGAYRSLVASIKKHRPDVAILIDFPDVNFRLARELKNLGIPVIYFVSPQLWAWKRRRLRWVQQRVSRMMVIFPFEERFYKARGVNAKFVGHPLAELPRPTVTREEYAAAHNLDPAKPWIALLPGSRWKEVTANLEVMMELAHRFPLGCDYILPVASTIDRKQLEEFIAGHEEWWPGDIDAALKLKISASSPTHAMPFTTPGPASSPAARRQSRLRSLEIPSLSSIVSLHSPSAWPSAWSITPPRSGRPTSSTPTATCPLPW